MYKKKFCENAAQVSGAFFGQNFGKGRFYWPKYAVNNS